MSSKRAFWPPLWLVRHERILAMSDVELVLFHDRCHATWFDLLCPLDTIKERHAFTVAELVHRGMTHARFGAVDALDSGAKEEGDA